jgi:sugar fermentation stimulation protein A
MDTLLMPFPGGCKQGIFLAREKRFRVLVDLGPSLGQVWVHTNNSGSMLGLTRPGVQALVSPAANPNRKLPYTLELIEHQGFWVGVNTLTPNRMLKAAHMAGRLPETRAYTDYKPEAKIGQSRLDALFTGPSGNLWVECKNVTMSVYGEAGFPDAVSARGLKHLDELARLAKNGDRAALFFLIQRPDAACFGPADYIDPAYAEGFAKALEAGVEVWAYTAAVTTQGIDLGKRLPLSERVSGEKA